APGWVLDEDENWYPRRSLAAQFRGASRELCRGTNAPPLGAHADASGCNPGIFRTRQGADEGRLLASRPLRRIVAFHRNREAAVSVPQADPRIWRLQGRHDQSPGQAISGIGLCRFRQLRRFTRGLARHASERSLQSRRKDAEGKTERLVREGLL